MDAIPATCAHNKVICGVAVKPSARLFGEVLTVVFAGSLPQECEVLARAMKEWERRETERHGFSDQPGDCMAFKYLRDVSGVGQDQLSVSLRHKSL
jgi:hypothetical protein